MAAFTGNRIKAIITFFFCQWAEADRRDLDTGRLKLSTNCTLKVLV